MDVVMIWLICGMVLGAVIIRSFFKWREGMRRKQISRRAQIGESEAEKLLARQGYRVLERQARRTAVMMVDGERMESAVRADFIAEKGGRTYLVEVKTGKQANVRLPNVRRQLFEYQNIFDTDGILFIDMNKYDMMEVSFESNAAHRPTAAAFFVGVAAGVCLMVLLYSYH